MSPRAGFATHWGFYLAAVGSAFGLGNLWRFPYVVGENGGGAFLLLYVLATAFIGLPLLCGELALGKSTRQGPVGALDKVSQDFRGGKSKPAAFRWIGHFSLIASVILLSYFAVVCGWVLHFSVQYAVGVFVGGPVQAADLFAKLMANGPMQWGLSSVHLIICALVVGRGVQAGIERWVGMIMPLFIGLLIYLIYESLQLQGATEALRFLFYPDFHQLNFSSAIKAIGHVLFTLSLGFGSMIVFGSYMREDMNVPEAAVRVVGLDTLLSLSIGLLIFPIVFSGGLRPDTGPTILFETIPMLLVKVGLSDFFGLIFFLCAYLAGLGGSLGLMEVTVSSLVDRTKIPRAKVAWIIGGVSFALCTLPAFSSNLLRRIQINGMNLLESFDSGLIHWVLPVIAVALSLVVGFRMNRKTLRAQFVWDERRTTKRLFDNWIFVLRWVIPILITLALSLELLGYSLGFD